MGGSSWTGGYTKGEVDLNLPRPDARDGYDPNLGIPKGYADRRSWLQKETEAQRTRQNAELDRLRAYATGEESMARDQAGVQRARQGRAYESLGRTAQRGGRSASAQSAAAYGADESARNIEAQSVIAQQLEKQRAAQAYSAAAESALKSQIGLEQLGRGYAQMGVQDKDKWNAYRRYLDSLYRQKKGLSMGDKLTESESDQKLITGTVGLVTGLIPSLLEGADY